MSKWRDIETAPTDGMRVLLFSDGHTGVGSYDKWARDEHGRIIGCEDKDYPDRWTWDGEGFDIDPPPSHWMPLPDAPE